jgi:hypothetical protein
MNAAKTLKTVNKSVKNCHECSPRSFLLPTTILSLEMHQSLLPMLQTTTKMLVAAVGSSSCSRMCEEIVNQVFS